MVHEGPSRTRCGGTRSERRSWRVRWVCTRSPLRRPPAGSIIATPCRIGATSSRNASSSIPSKCRRRGIGSTRSIPASLPRCREVPDIVNASAHSSHAYRSGLNLYFSFAVRPEDPAAMADRYRTCWQRIIETTAALGGGIAHHHGIGRVRAPYLHHDLGSAGIAVLRRVKAALDPTGIMNPGVLLPDTDGRIRLKWPAPSSPSTPVRPAFARSSSTQISTCWVARRCAPTCTHPAPGRVEQDAAQTVVRHAKR